MNEVYSPAAARTTKADAGIRHRIGQTFAAYIVAYCVWAFERLLRQYLMAHYLSFETLTNRHNFKK